MSPSCMATETGVSPLPVGAGLVPETGVSLVPKSLAVRV